MGDPALDDVVLVDETERIDAIKSSFAMSMPQRILTGKYSST
jgi:hypothetical protein